MTTMTNYLDELTNTLDERAQKLASDDELRQMALTIAEVLTGEDWPQLDFVGLDVNTRSYLGRAEDIRARGMSLDLLRRLAREDRNNLRGFLIVSHELENREA